jgi:hypothetical protein
MDCNHEKNTDKPEFKTKTVVLIDEREDVSEPKDLKSYFRSLNEWLLNACDNEHPRVGVEKFKFGLFESPNEYIMFFVGFKTENKQDSLITHIVFKPTNMYYRLQKNEYENLSPEELREKIKSELKNFTNTEKFKSSFFAKAKSIELEYDEEKIWSN